MTATVGMDGDPIQAALGGTRLTRLRAAGGRRRLGVWIPAAALLAITLLALLAPILEPHSPLLPAGLPDEKPFSPGFLLGTDEIGRDMLSRVLAGFRTSWFATLAVIAVGVGVGTAVGLVAGASGKVVDSVLMRITDLFLALPATLLAVAIVAVLGPSLGHTMIALMIVWWPYYARLVRGEVKALAARPHIEAARLAGAGPARRMIRHLLPGAVPTIVVTASLDVGGVLVALATLSFLGLGAAQPAPELGSMTADGMANLLTSWWTAVIPALAVFVLAFVANLAGDAFRRTLTLR